MERFDAAAESSGADDAEEGAGAAGCGGVVFTDGSCDAEFGVAAGWTGLGLGFVTVLGEFEELRAWFIVTVLAVGVS